MENKERDPKRDWVLIPVKQLLLWGRFATYQETLTQIMLHTFTRSHFESWYLKKPIPIFVSHRWDTPEKPDPSGRQFHMVIRFIIEAICLSKGICERFFSYAEPEIVLNPTLKHRIQSQKTDFSRGMDELQEFQETHGKGPFGPPMEILLAQWLRSNFEFLNFELEEIIAISNILRDVIVWYDYTSLPQSPGASDKEKDYRSWALDNLEHLIVGANTVIIWDQQGINRGWCVLEGLISETVQNASYHAVPNTRLPNDNWGSAIFNLDPKYKNQHPNKQIAQSVLELRQTFLGKDTEQIVEGLRARGIKCTYDDDLAKVAKILKRFISQNS